MKYVHLPLDLSAAVLPVIEWSLGQTIQAYGGPHGVMNPQVQVELENLVNTLRAEQQRLLNETRR